MHIIILTLVCVLALRYLAVLSEIGLEFLKSGIELTLLIPLRMFWVPQSLQNRVSTHTP